MHTAAVARRHNKIERCAPTGHPDVLNMVCSRVCHRLCHILPSMSHARGFASVRETLTIDHQNNTLVRNSHKPKETSFKARIAHLNRLRHRPVQARAQRGQKGVKVGGDGFLGDVFGVGEVNDSCRGVSAHTYRLSTIGDQSAQRVDDFLVVRALANKRGTDRPKQEHGGDGGIRRK